MNSLDVRALSCRAYHHVKGQMPLLSQQRKTFVVVVDFSTEVAQGVLKFETFVGTVPVENTLPVFPSVHPNAPAADNQTISIKVQYTTFGRKREFAFHAPFDTGILKGSVCNCIPFPTTYPSICRKHKKYPTTGMATGPDEGRK